MKVGCEKAFYLLKPVWLCTFAIGLPHDNGCRNLNCVLCSLKSEQSDWFGSSENTHYWLWLHLLWGKPFTANCLEYEPLKTFRALSALLCLGVWYHFRYVIGPSRTAPSIALRMQIQALLQGWFLGKQHWMSPSASGSRWYRTCAAGPRPLCPSKSLPGKLLRREAMIIWWWRTCWPAPNSSWHWGKEIMIELMRWLVLIDCTEVLYTGFKLSVKLLWSYGEECLSTASSQWTAMVVYRGLFSSCNSIDCVHRKFSSLGSKKTQKAIKTEICCWCTVVL